ncbi:class I adenylate-forming enzyme family protein [Haloarchaeobius litoreus]|uniref:AMP-binding protein n=1 Tax=Haloarchaeobius litoreus TaxID=755306 RepID=A0ABD6DNP1_9EURY|nr:class I adenylate-forming enzyme family protein [Haloarchaeobius litoreus]
MAHGTTLLDSIAAGARWYPDREALVQGERDRTVTYGELYEASRSVAHGLRGAGVEPGDRVAMVDRSTVEHTIAFLGVLWAGALPATVHFRESQETITAMVDRLDPTAVVFQPDLHDVVSPLVDTLASVELFVALDGLGDVPSFARPMTELRETDPGELPSVAPTDRAFINFSSGTTGVPKPVVHTHANVVESSHLGIFKKQIGPRTRTLKTNTPSFIAWANATFPTLTAGATVVYLERSDPAEILATVEAERVTSLVLVPTVWKHIVAAGTTAYDLTSVELAGYAGAPLDPPLFEAIRTSICERVTTMYGTTETMSSSTVLFPEDVTTETLDSIGYPAPNTELRLVEPDSRDPSAEVAQGDPGEILIRGPCVADEIWDDPAATADSFHDDGWVYTGDLAAVGDDGLLYLLGRADNMILSGGINVYPEKVRAALVDHPRIEDAAVVGVPHPEWGETPKAFIVSADPELDEADLEELCRELPALADYQRPRRFELVDSLPRTGTNKLDYAALRGSTSN